MKGAFGVLGINFDEIVILAVIAVVVLGPDRLPRYARQLAGLVRHGRTLLGAAQERARDELGPEFGAIDWKRLDPRQYDPRQIIRRALLEEPGSSTPGASVRRPESGSPAPASDAGRG